MWKRNISYKIPPIYSPSPDRYTGGIPEDSRIAHGGHLKKETLTELTLKRIQALNEITQQRGQTLAEMALAWILKDEYVTSASWEQDRQRNWKRN